MADNEKFAWSEESGVPEVYESVEQALEAARPPQADDHAIQIYAQILNGMTKSDSQFVHYEGFSDLWDAVAADIAKVRRTNPDATFYVPNE